MFEELTVADFYLYAGLSICALNKKGNPAHKAVYAKLYEVVMSFPYVKNWVEVMEKLLSKYLMTQPAHYI